MIALSVRAGRLAIVGLFLFLLPGIARADGKMSGIVTDASGQGIADVKVQLIPEDKGLSPMDAKSKKNGNYLFGFIRPGKYRAKALKEGYRISRIDVDKLEPPEKKPSWSAHVEVPPGAEIPAFQVASNSELTFNFKLTPTTTGPGQYGTGEALVPIDAILKMVQGGEFDKAEAEIERNIKEKPNDATWQYVQAYALYLHGRPADALPAVDRALQLEGGREGFSLLRGMILVKLDRVDDAIGAFKAETTAAQTKNGQRDAWSNLAVVEKKAGHAEGAVAALEKVIEVAPEMTDAYYELADLYTQQKRLDKVQEINEKLKGAGLSEDPDILFNLGADRYNKGDMKGATEIFSKVVQLKPDYADAWLQLGYAQINQGDKQAAQVSLKKYLELKPDGSEAATARAFLEKISK